MSGPSRDHAMWKPRKGVLDRKRPAPKPWAHRHTLKPLTGFGGELAGYCCADAQCDEVFTPNGRPSDPAPRLNDKRPQARIFREGSNHKLRRLLRARSKGAGL